MTKTTSNFWREMTQLAISNRIAIDRPKGSSHPRYPEVIYSLDYGYLEDTTSSDGSGIDLWLVPQQVKVVG
ncbi:MAG: hypothetical protein L0287_08220 [Anaerolineae bacterium]|nr:hypothetical protein [Anaerolineae bacterium]